MSRFTRLFGVNFLNVRVNACVKNLTNIMSGALGFVTLPTQHEDDNEPGNNKGGRWARSNKLGHSPNQENCQIFQLS